METKTRTIPFDVKRAKRIQAGESPGKIVTKEGKNVRIVCWDRKAKRLYRIVGLMDRGTFEEPILCMENGKTLDDIQNNKHLELQVPEWAQYEDGDILACELHNAQGERCRWLSILRENIGARGDTIQFTSYVSYDYDFPNDEPGLDYDDYVDYAGSVRLATEEEKQMFVDALKASSDRLAREYLKRFFGVETKKVYHFEPFQKVLVRCGDDSVWEASFFSHLCDKIYPYVSVGGVDYLQCIPYNDRTKHLLGTADDWEEQE